MRERSASSRRLRQLIAEPVPRAAMLAAWANSWADAACAADDLIDAMSMFGTHTITDDHGNTETLIVALARLRSNTDQRRPDRSGGRPSLLRAVLPVPGDPTGLPGPPDLNQDAIEAGQAVVVNATGITAIPVVTGEATNWMMRQGNPDRAAVAGLRPEQADTAMRSALLAATEVLTDLDPAADRDAVGDALRELDRRLQRVTLPTSMPGPLIRTTHTAAKVLGIVAVAQHLDEQAVPTPDREHRAAALAGLAADARRALAAAASAPHRGPLDADQKRRSP